MEMPDVPEDFKEFLKLLNARRVEYLVIGGFAVAHYGYIRPTADMDVWVGMSVRNGQAITEALKEFGFAVDALKPELFTKKDQLVRMGVPPLQLELSTTISGVEFDACYHARRMADFGGVAVPVISLADLRINKKASGRLKDLADLESLPEAEGDGDSGATP
jgi:hypothetical protein